MNSVALGDREGNEREQLMQNQSGNVMRTQSS